MYVLYLRPMPLPLTVTAVGWVPMAMAMDKHSESWWGKTSLTFHLVD